MAQVFMKTHHAFNMCNRFIILYSTDISIKSVVDVYMNYIHFIYSIVSINSKT